MSNEQREITYVAAENVREALAVCQSPSCRSKRHLTELLKRMHKHRMMKKMVGWKLTITAERIEDKA